MVSFEKLMKLLNGNRSLNLIFEPAAIFFETSLAPYVEKYQFSEKNNLFQVSCSDVRERFHLFSLLFIVVVQTMKEYGWKEGKMLF